MRAPPLPSPRRRRALLALASLTLALAAAEAVLRAAPRLLPTWWRTEHPWWGIEFFQPGVLATLPLDAVPVPLPWTTLEDRAPTDLASQFGLLDRASDPDVVRGELIIQAIDADGFPNERVLERADVVLVGDSFAFTAGITRPPGLVIELQRSTGLLVYDVACPGLGPQQIAWLIEHHALPKQPRVVMWLFFAGNDLQQASSLAEQHRGGLQTQADLPTYRPVPASWLLGWAWRLVAGSPDPEVPDRPVEGARLLGPDGPPLWFSPTYLQPLVATEDEWRSHPGFAATCDAVAAAREHCRAAGATLLFVYIPSKGQVLLPYLAHDKQRVHAMVFHGAAATPPLTAEEYYKRALRNRDSLEHLLAEWCAAEDVPFLSATPPLRALAARGRPGYYSGDSHWNAEGQRALLEPLQAWLATQPAPP